MIGSHVYNSLLESGGVAKLVEALANAEEIIAQYANYLEGISYHELEAHPYIPSVEGVKDATRALLAQLNPQHAEALTKEEARG